MKKKESREQRKKRLREEEALARFADKEMYGDDADYHEAAGLEFGNK